MKITILTENTANKRGFLAEHGLSVLLEVAAADRDSMEIGESAAVRHSMGTGESAVVRHSMETGTFPSLRILFDTGQSKVYLHNAVQLGISLNELNGIVLSHGHYDHTGGLEFWKEQKTDAIPATCPAAVPIVYIRKNALEDKLCRNSDGSTFRRIAVPWRTLAEPERELGISLHYTQETEEIFPNVFVVSNIPAVVPEEPDGTDFYVAEADEEEMAQMMPGGQNTENVLRPVRYRPDRMTDEQLLVIRTGKGLAVFAGCAHVGILNCLEQVKKQFPEEPFFLLLAGMHLRGCSTERIEQTIKKLHTYGFEYIIPVHCTGQEAILRMREAFGARCLSGEAGKVFEL